LNPHHNHSASEDASSHTVNQKLTASLYNQMKNLGNTGLKPSAILEALKKTNPGKTILATMTTIYSARKKAQQQMLQGISPVMHLKQTLANSDFTTNSKVNDKGKLKGLFFCHSRSVELLDSYHHILLLDCTYKKNK
jgi:mRNA deadenylase 3'-5' endonuclease subunit Ccr4